MSRSSRIAFDESFDPPAPVLPVGIGGIEARSPSAMLRMLVDTGADCTLIPVRLARSLRLPWVDKVEVQGVGGATRAAAVHAARLRIAGVRALVRVVALGDEALLGRDVLNRLSLELDGPAGMISVTQRAKRPRK